MVRMKKNKGEKNRFKKKKASEEERKGSCQIKIKEKSFI